MKEARRMKGSAQSANDLLSLVFGLSYGIIVGRP